MREPKFTQGITALQFWFGHCEAAREYSLPAVFLDENEVATTPIPQVFDYPDWWYVWLDLDKLVNSLSTDDRSLVAHYFQNIFNHDKLTWHRWKRKEDFKVTCYKFFMKLPKEYRGKTVLNISKVLASIHDSVKKGEIKLEEIKPDFFYTAQEVAYILRYSDQTIHELLKSGRLKGVKIGQWRIKGEHLLEFINQPYTEVADD